MPKSAARKLCCRGVLCGAALFTMAAAPAQKPCFILINKTGCAAIVTVNGAPLCYISADTQSSMQSVAGYVKHGQNEITIHAVTRKGGAGRLHATLHCGNGRQTIALAGSSTAKSSSLVGHMNFTTNQRPPYAFKVALRVGTLSAKSRRAVVAAVQRAYRAMKADSAKKLARAFSPDLAKAQGAPASAIAMNYQMMLKAMRAQHAHLRATPPTTWRIKAFARGVLVYPRKANHNSYLFGFFGKNGDPLLAFDQFVVCRLRHGWKIMK